MTFGPGANDRQCIDIPLINDTVMEEAENFTADIVIFAEDSDFVMPGDPDTTIVTLLGRFVEGAWVHNTKQRKLCGGLLPALCGGPLPVVGEGLPP